MAFFYAMAKLKQNNAGKSLNVTNMKADPSNRPNTKQLISLIVKMTTIWATPSILTMFYPLTSLKITNSSLFCIALVS